jgi:4-amino-4-deoxy-L-arabinose transferase-like glycosyltransferase
MTQSRLLAAIILIYVALASWFAVVTPYRTEGVLKYQRGSAKDIGAPDERQHVNYIVRLANGEGFPVFNAKDPNFYETYQSHQPPLYYVLGAGFSKIVGQGVQLRWLNVLIGVGTLLGIYYLALWGSGRAELGVLAAGIAGLLPMFLALHGAVSNDPLLFCLCTWALAFGVRFVKEQETKHLALFALCAGLGILTRTSAIGLLLVGFMIPFLLPADAKQSKVMILAAALVGPLLIASPWLIRNNGLYGDPLAASAFTNSFTGNPTPAQMIASFEQGLGMSNAAATQDYWFNWFGWWTLRSFYGVFGYMDIFLSPTVYRVLMALSLVALGAHILGIFRDENKSDTKAMRWLCGAFLLAATVLYLRFNLTYFQAQARYLYPAIAPISLILASGVLYLAKKQAKVVTLGVLCALAAANMLIIPYVTKEFAERVR